MPSQHSPMHLIDSALECNHSPQPARWHRKAFERLFELNLRSENLLSDTDRVKPLLLEVEFSALDSCVKSHEGQLKEYAKLIAMLEELEASPSYASNPAVADYRLKLKLLKGSLDKLRDTKPRIDNGLFLRLLMGKVNMSLWKHADRLNFKDEYNKFKSRTTYIYILWPLLQLIAMWLAPSLWASQGELILRVHQLWCLYYYMTLSLRENILLANGSAILHWWIYHHYLSMLISLIMLLFPNDYVLQHRILEMLVFGLIQGLVMMFQNNYQKKRLYTRKALGKAKAIDVESTETLVEKPTDLAILIPMLFVLYLIELYFGFSFIHSYYHRGDEIEYPVSVLIQGACFIILAIGNAYTTGIVLVTKKQSRDLKQAVQDRVAHRASVSGASGAAASNTAKNK